MNFTPIKIKNKKAFIYGALLIIAVVCIVLLREKPTVVRGNPVEEWYVQLIILFVGIFMAAYGLVQNSRIAFVGKKIYGLLHKQIGDRR